MAMYKVNVTVYKNPAGKTMVLPTFVRAVGSYLLAMCVCFFIALVIALVQNKGKVNLLITAVVFVLDLIGIVLGMFLRGWAERRAQQSFMKALAKQEEQK